LGLHPWDYPRDRFWRMSGKDIDDEYIAYLARLDRQWEQTALIVSYIIAANTKKGKAPKITKLLPNYPFAAHVKKLLRN
jgi:hypothetical protein